MQSSCFFSPVILTSFDKLQITSPTEFDTENAEQRVASMSRTNSHSDIRTSRQSSVGSANAASYQSSRSDSRSHLKPVPSDSVTPSIPTQDVDEYPKTVSRHHDDRLDEPSGYEPSSATAAENVEHPCSHIKGQLVDLLLQHYDSYRKSQSGQSSDSSSATIPATSQVSCEGKQVNRGAKRVNEPDDDGGDESNGSGDRAPKKSKTHEEGRRYFACPFFKADPVKYNDCHRFRLTRIRDVKQHLRRCHCRPIYCSICGETFSTEDDRDTHARLRSCQETRFRIDGITKTQQDRLSEKLPRKTPEEAQWFAVFEIIFPDSPRPSSAYPDPDLSKETQAFREYVTRDGPAFLLNHMRLNHVWTLEDDVFLVELLRDGLERLVRRWSRDHPQLEPQQTADQLRPATSPMQAETIPPHVQPFNVGPLAPLEVTNDLPAHANDTFPSDHTVHNSPAWDPLSTNFPSFSSFGFGNNLVDNWDYLPAPNAGSISTAFVADLGGAPEPLSRARPPVAYGHLRGEMEHFGLAEA